MDEDSVFSGEATPIPREGTWAERVPISDAQHCAICGQEYWSWVYPLESPPAGPVALPYFWCVCSDCHEAIEAGNPHRLIARSGPDHVDDPYPFADVVLPLFQASRAGNPVPRADAQ